MGIYKITRNFFPNLAVRLGLVDIPSDYALASTVLPVTIVDQDISLNVIPTTLIFNLPFTTGPQLSIAANQVIADTGALLGGNYNAFIMLGIDSGVAGAGGSFNLQRRDAANATSVWTQLMFYNNNGTTPILFQFAFFANVNERLRIIAANAWTVGANGQASIFLNPAA